MGRRFEDAVAAQGDSLRLSRQSVIHALSRMDLRPFQTGRLCFVGIGASSHALPAVVAFLTRHGRAAVSFDADEVPSLGEADFFDALVAVSQGGHSPETAAALAAAPFRPSIAVTAEPSSPVARLADAVISLGPLEDSTVYTMGFTATLQALGLLADRLCETYAGWDLLPQLVDETLDSSSDVIANLLRHGYESIDFVASGAHLAAAREGALIVREAALVPSAWFPTRQYLHGPIEALSPDRLLVVLGDGREVALARQAADAGAGVLLVTGETSTADGGVPSVFLPPLDEVPLAVLEVLPLQLLAGGLARSKGLSIDSFRFPQDDTKLTEEPERHQEVAVGLDVGGSKLAVALVSRLEPEPLFFEARPTPRTSPEAVFAAAAGLVADAVSNALRLGDSVVSIGVGMPELVDLEGRVVSDVVVPGLGALVSRRELVAGLTSIVESDVRAAATAEAILGAGRSYRIFCYLSVGTGISYCLVRDRATFRGARGLAIQLGNSVIATGSSEWERSRFVLEERASGTAIAARYHALAGMPLSTEEILGRIDEDETAREVVEAAAADLATGISLLVNLLDPEAVVVGGGLGSAPGPFFDRASLLARDQIWSEQAQELPIVQAHLGARSAAIGAALVSRHRRSGRRKET